MSFGTLVFSSKDWLIPAILLVGIAAAILVWSYRATPADRNIRLACFSLKLIGLITLGLVLLEPLLSRERARPGSNMFVILADNSQGMNMRDNLAAKTRGETMRDILASDTVTWQTRLNEDFQVRRYLFDSRLQSSRDLSELVFDGRASSLGSALNTIKERYKGQPLAGVLLFTDGNATDLKAGAPDLEGLPPIYPVVIGKDTSIKDISIQNVAVTQSSFEDAPVTIQVDVEASGYSKTNIVAQLLNQDGEVVQSQTQVAPESDQTAVFRFRIRPKTADLAFYRVQIAIEEEEELSEEPEKSSEATLANNARVIVADRDRGPYRVLYVCGRPNWEYKFLGRSLAEDDQIEMSALQRVARREPKFEFKGRSGESTNPLFRGFDKTNEETERYDQPVLIRLKVRDETELRDGFPDTREELFVYDAIIVDDLEAKFFTYDQMGLIKAFVSERGGGFLMLGGQESFQQGEYARTPIGDVLPVYLDFIKDTSPLDRLKFSLTREGWLQPWARLYETESEERQRFERMDRAPFRVINRVRDVKPGSSVIGEVRDQDDEVYPALVVQRFGRGRAGAMLVGDLWRWSMHREEGDPDDLGKMWRQLIRWMVADIPKRIELEAEPRSGDPNHAIQLNVRARNMKFESLDNGTVKLKVEPVTIASQPRKESNANGSSTNAAVKLTPEPSLSEAGFYQDTYIPRATGGYRAEAIVMDENGIEAGRAEIGWTVDFAADEFRSLKPNRALLETIAKQTGGEMIEPGALQTFVASLPNRKAPITESWSKPIWQHPIVFLFALCCFVAEWGLRRWKGMA
jgi:uncharacterized membrane protein